MMATPSKQMHSLAEVKPDANNTKHVRPAHNRVVRLIRTRKGDR